VSLSVLLHPKVFSSLDDLWGGQSWLPPAFEPALVWFRGCCFVGQVPDLQGLPQPPAVTPATSA